MASIYRTARLNVPASAAWDVVDKYTRTDIHVFSVVAKQHMEGDWRICESPDGHVARELNITVDPEHMRASYTVPDLFESTFHHASMQVFDNGDGSSTLTWITDVLPDTFVEEHADLYDGLWSDLVQAVETGKDVDWPSPATA